MHVFYTLLHETCFYSNPFSPTLGNKKQKSSKKFQYFSALNRMSMINNLHFWIVIFFKLDRCNFFLHSILNFSLLCPFPSKEVNSLKKTLFVLASFFCRYSCHFTHQWNFSENSAAPKHSTVQWVESIDPCTIGQTEL